MMKNVLFFTFNEMNAFNGISKKIGYQKKALEANGFNVHLMYAVVLDEQIVLYINDEQIFSCSNNVRWTLKLIPLKQQILLYTERNNIKNVYVRYTQYASPVIVDLFCAFKRIGMKITLEIPSYPYGNEFRTWRQKMFLMWEQYWCKRIAKYVDNIVTFSNYTQIWGRPTLKIKNGIDFSSIALKSTNQLKDGRMDIIAVAGISFWHGFDRVIEGLKLYYENHLHEIKVYFNVVGKGDIATYNSLVNLAAKYNLNKYVIFHGEQFGTALDALFESADVAIGCLGCHRKKIKEISSLKNVEYAARGIPFIYSEINKDFDVMPYVKKEKPDDSPINIDDLVNWRKTVKMQPIKIRNSVINKLSWVSQMKIIAEQLNS